MFPCLADPYVHRGLRQWEVGLATQCKAITSTSGAAFPLRVSHTSGCVMHGDLMPQYGRFKRRI
jgi:hypothetical protein